ncbi:MAG: helix-turn-helix transcriptional regulator [Clostridiales bacterium]|nr:helix-turn-helix transcriptional regulator [Clostridiales bacterium]
MKNELVLKTLKEIRVFQDPYRQQIIKVYEQSNKPMTAKQVADILGETPSKVHYHVKVLEKFSFLVLSHTENINGIIARYMKIAYHNVKIQRSNDNKIKDEIYTMVENQFDKMKENYINRLKKLPVGKEHFRQNGSLKNGIVYLTEEQMYELVDYIEKLTKETKQYKGQEKYYGWDMFVSMIRIKKQGDKVK